jgi:hypothetical protein
VRQYVALTDDASPGNPRMGRFEFDRQSASRFSDNLEVPFHGPAQHPVGAITLWSRVRDELPNRLRGVEPFP